MKPIRASNIVRTGGGGGGEREGERERRGRGRGRGNEGEEGMINSYNNTISSLPHDACHISG